MTKTFQVTPAMKRIIGNVLDGKDIQTGGKTLSGVAQTCGALFRFGVLDLKNQLTEHGMELARVHIAKRKRRSVTIADSASGRSDTATSNQGG